MARCSIVVLSVLLLLEAVACQTGSTAPSPIARSATATSPARRARSTTTLPRLAFRKHDGSHVSLAVEIAASPESQAAGLSGRSELAPDEGLLFLFPVAGAIAFWMHDTSIPLSIAFVDDSLKITELQDMQPFTDTRHMPPAPIRYAVEANLGFFSGHGVTVGDDVILDEIIDYGPGNH